MNPGTGTSRTVPLDVFGRKLNLKACCLNVRHKMMYIDPAQASPGMVDEGSDSRVFLCMKTQEVTGPDGQLCSPSNCSEGRACYEGASRPMTHET